MDGDGRAGADARAVMRDGCATVRRLETRAMKRSACAEVERTRRRARARRDVWDTFARAESRLAETRLGRNGTVADVHERASRIAYIPSETTTTVGGGPRDGVWVKITKRARARSLKATAAKNKSYDGSRDLLKQTSAECGDEANECDACDAGGADGELNERIDADDGSVRRRRRTASARRRRRRRRRSVAPGISRARAASTDDAFCDALAHHSVRRARSNDATNHRLAARVDVRRLANFIRPTSVASHRRLRVEQRLEQIVQIVRAHPSTVREPPEPGSTRKSSPEPAARKSTRARPSASHRLFSQRSLNIPYKTRTVVSKHLSKHSLRVFSREILPILIPVRAARASREILRRAAAAAVPVPTPRRTSRRRSRRRARRSLSPTRRAQFLIRRTDLLKPRLGRRLLGAVGVSVRVPLQRLPAVRALEFIRRARRRHAEQDVRIVRRRRRRARATGDSRAVVSLIPRPGPRRANRRHPRRPRRDRDVHARASRRARRGRDRPARRARERASHRVVE